MSNTTHSSLRIRNLDIDTKNQKQLDKTHTNLLRRVQNIHWNEHPTKERNYEKLQPISDTLRCRCLLSSRHCLRAEDEIISLLLLWKKNIPIQSHRMTFPEMLSRDTGIALADLSNAMLDQNLRKTVVQNIPAGTEG